VSEAEAKKAGFKPSGTPTTNAALARHWSARGQIPFRPGFRPPTQISGSRIGFV